MRTRLRIRDRLAGDQARANDVLKQVAVLSTPACAARLYERWARLAGALSGSPVVLLSFLDNVFECYLPAADLPGIPAVPRGQSLGGYVLLQAERLVIPDIQADPRFAAHPLVTTSLRLRFYAGYPLRAPDGSWQGVLAVGDHRPRRPDLSRLLLLQDLAAVVESDLWRHAA